MKVNLLHIIYETYQNQQVWDSRKMKKLLQAQVDLNDNINPGDINNAIALLEQYPEAFKTLFTEQYKTVYNILQLRFPTEKETQQLVGLSFDHQLKQLVNIGLRENLLRSFHTLIQKNKFHLLCNIVVCKHLFNEDIQDQVGQKIKQKVVMATTMIKEQGKPQKHALRFIFIPHFFISINILEDQISFDETITDYFNALVPDSPFEEKLFFQALYALGFYNAMNTKLDEYIKHNQGYAQFKARRLRNNFHEGLHQNWIDLNTK